LPLNKYYEKKHLWEDMPKETKAAAEKMNSTASVEPPDFNLGSQADKNNAPIQGMFKIPKIKKPKKKKKKKGMSFGPIDVVKTPTAGGSVPIPYPNIGGIGSKNKKSSKSGINLPDMGQLGSGLGSLVEQGKGMLKSAGKTASDTAEGFLGSGDTFMNAVTYSHDLFGLLSRFQNITIMSQSAIGTPGCLCGPTLESNIKYAPGVADMTGDQKLMRNAIAKGVSDNFDNWRSQVMVPGLPWYPSFVAFPAAHAPPMPNIPTPLITCPSSHVSDIVVPEKIKSSIWSNLPSDLKTPENEAFIQGLAARIAMHFEIWLMTQMVMNVLGYGPVPSFFPPSVPVGPVIGGSIISVPGHLAN
jgi:hypothetical protein